MTDFPNELNQPSGLTPGESMMKHLCQDARVNNFARMPPMSEKWNDEQINQVRATFLGYVAENSVADTVVAKQTGYSPGVISEWRRSIYQGDNEEVAKEIDGWLRRDSEQRRAALRKDYIETGVCEEMRGIVKAACATLSMAVLVVPSGCGKTMMMEMLSASKEFGGYYMYCDEDLSPRAFIINLCKLMGIQHWPAVRHDLKSKIIDKLRGTGRPVYLDEAHLLPRDCFSRIRSIHDQAKVPFIMAGTYEIIERIDDRANARGQMARRCLRYNAMDHVYNAESPDGSRKGRPLFSREEIKNFLKKLEVRVEPAAFELMWSLACQPGSGGLGILSKIVQFSKKYGNTLDRAMILNIMSIMGGEHGAYMARTAERNIEGLRKLA